jgi:hypothetical protein
VENAVPVVDSKAPILYSHVYHKPKVSLRDAARLREIEAENKRLLKRISVISRSKARQST